MNETPSARLPETPGEETRATEAAEAQTLAQRAAAPEAGQQDWLAAEEVAVEGNSAQPQQGATMHGDSKRSAQSEGR